MADTETKKEEILIQPFSVDRNGKSITFSQHKITRGENKDGVYPAPEIDEKNVMDIVAWVGPQAIAGILQSFLKRVAQGWSDEATDDITKEFSEAKFKTLAASFSVIGETKKVLEERLRALQLELQKVDVMKVMGPEAKEEDKKAFMELAQRIQSVSTAIEQKRRDRKEEDSEPVSSV